MNEVRKLQNFYKEDKKEPAKEFAKEPAREPAKELAKELAKEHVKEYLKKIDEKVRDYKKDKQATQEKQEKQEYYRQGLIKLGKYKLKVLKEIHEEFEEYLIKRFKKSFEIYKQYMWKLKKNDIFDCIATVENVSRESLLEVFEEIVLEKRKVYQELGLKYFLFLKEKDRINEEMISKFKQKGYIVYQDIYIPLAVLNLLQEGSILEKDFCEYGKLILVFVRHLERESSSGLEEKRASEGQRIFKRILERAINIGVSDIHLIPGTSLYYVYFRKDGLFDYQEDLTLSLEEADNFIVYLMRRAAEEVGGQFNPDTRLAYQDARISVTEAKAFWNIDRDIDVRIAFIPDGTPKSRLEVCMRILYKEASKPKKLADKAAQQEEDLFKRLKRLGYFEEDIRILWNVLHKRNGIVLISGVTNSGKSTLVSNLLSTIKDKKIGTIEDPIEYYIDLPNYVQHQIFISNQERISMDFVDYVKAFKRADYDIVFVGEWRNHEGLTEAILEQAYAGQLIFTTLHVGTSFQVLKGLESVFRVNIEELKPVLLLCWNQVLIPRLCVHCRKKVKTVSVKPEILEVCKSFSGMTEEMINQLESFVLKDGYVRGEGCEKCGGKGYSGRQVVYDYFLPTVDFWANVGNDYSPYNVIKSARIKKTKVDVFLQIAKLGLVDINDVYLII